MIPLAAKLLAGSSLQELNPVKKNRHGVAVKFPVFSSHAIHDVDLKLGPEMKSTGEGMYVGYNPESAMKKIFADVWNEKGSIYFKGDEELKSLAEQAGFIVQTSGFKDWIKRTDKALHINLTDSNEAKRERKEAITHGVGIMTEEETVRAFLRSGCGATQAVSLKDLYKKEVETCLL